MGGEDKTFKLTKETVVMAGKGAVGKREDLKIDGAVVLRLSVDQKAANRIMVQAAE